MTLLNTFNNRHQAIFTRCMFLPPSLILHLLRNKNSYLQAHVCPSLLMLHLGSPGAGSCASGLRVKADFPPRTCHRFITGPRRETNTIHTRTCGLLELPVSPASRDCHTGTTYGLHTARRRVEVKHTAVCLRGDGTNRRAAVGAALSQQGGRQRSTR